MSNFSNFINRDDDDWMLSVAIHGTQCQSFDALLNSRSIPMCCDSCEHLKRCYAIVDQINNDGQPLE